MDLSQPLLPQVGALGADYDRWVHRPVSPRTAQRLHEASGGTRPAWSGSLRIFRSDFWERQSHIPWWLVLVVWVPIVAALAVWSVVALGHGPASLLGALGAGILLWTLVEYVLHRWLFHYKPRSSFGRRLHFLAHGIHHLDPWDATRLVFPPVAGLGIAGAIFGGLYLALGLAWAVPVMAGLLMGYLAYDMTHYYTHHAKPRSRWGKFLKAYHLAHHHKHWERMFGVSQPLWDVVFRTGRPRA